MQSIKNKIGLRVTLEDLRDKVWDGSLWGKKNLVRGSLGTENDLITRHQSINLKHHLLTRVVH